MFGRKKKKEKTSFGSLIESLSIPQGTDLNIKFSPEALSFVGNGHEFEINFEKWLR